MTSPTIRLRSASLARRVGFASTAALAGVLLFSGCSALADQAVAAPKPSATHTTEDSGIAVTCSAVSAIQTAINGAMTERTAGTLTDAQFAGIVNLIPFQLKGITQRPDAGLRDEIASLIADTAHTAPIVAGASFNPDGAPFRDDMLKVQNA
ncbi:hypothetical protein GCM10023171_09680 [Microbacterium panaciterrae]|uniref:Lipoprotein n=2 Tax=Microbacterium panaciterrae TaxID=985759 RepID=A0ABP8P6I6_9MICO